LAPTLWARSNTALRAFNEGVKEFNAKEYDHAIPFFSDAIEADSALPKRILRAARAGITSSRSMGDPRLKCGGSAQPGLSASAGVARRGEL